VSSGWSAQRAEDYLLSRELFGMRFGLDRMQRLMTALGAPHRAFRSVHVVGTNGKSSTVRMMATILEMHGIRTGAYLSPHLVAFTERIRVGDADLDEPAFAAAVERAARAAELVDRTLGPDDRVTQFEALTAAAYSELAARGVDVAVVEAGLGGRYDATSVIPSEVQVLTNVGLEHTRWLGPTIAHIAGEKLAVVRDGATLVVGELHPEAEAQARAAADRHGARLVHAPAAADVPVAAPGAFQRANFAVATAAAEALLGELDPGALRAAGARVRIPGRCEVIDRDPLTIVDGAHNPAGARALAAALPEVAGERRRTVGVVSVLEDKDAAGILRELLPSCQALVLTHNANPRALPPATLQSLAGQLGADPVALELEPEPRRALARARELAGPDGAVVATGSIYLVADLVRPPGARRASML
jgi:dihydrofolate synthase/folylpolyglutamate synthase